MKRDVHVIYTNALLAMLVFGFLFLAPCLDAEQRLRTVLEREADRTDPAICHWRDRAIIAEEEVEAARLRIRNLEQLSDVLGKKEPMFSILVRRGDGPAETYLVEGGENLDRNEAKRLATELRLAFGRARGCTFVEVERLELGEEVGE